MNETKSNDQDVRKDALLTATLVLTDILPNYKTADAEDAKSSVAVKNAQKYEKKLQEAVKLVVAKLKSAHLITGLISLLSTCNPLIQSAAGEQLIAAVVSAAARGEDEAKKALADIFQNDVDLEISSALVKEISREKDPKRLENLMESMRFARTDLSHSIVSSTAPHALAKLEGDEAAEFRRDLLASSTEKDVARIKKHESAMLADVLVIYVKILRSHHLYSKETLRSVLHGMRRKATQLNIELMVDIVKELKDLANAYLLTEKGDIEMGIVVANTVFAVVGGKRSLVTDLAVSLTAEVLPKVVDQIACIDAEVLVDLATELGKFGDAKVNEYTARILFEGLLIQGYPCRQIGTRLLNLFARSGEDLKSLLDREEGRAITKPSFFWCLWALEHHFDKHTSTCIQAISEYSHDLRKKKRKVTPPAANKDGLHAALSAWVDSKAV